jgi:cellulose biosynthesis protein BcsQ
MSIITFYSYKGGVGRSMALANVAVLLARQGRRVMVVDWDLEAPGIEKYFADLRIAQSGPGLLPLLAKGTSRKQPDYRNFTWTVTALDKTFEFTFLHAGREADPEYFKRLEHFEWSTFFRKGGGNFLEHLREQWLADFEFVLIDSRTGLSDAGGICTIQLPDIIVALFTPAHQSLFGVRDVMRLAQTARQRLAFDRDALSVVPGPSRVDRQQPSFENWIQLFATELNEFFADWLPFDPC